MQQSKEKAKMKDMIADIVAGDERKPPFLIVRKMFMQKRSMRNNA